MVEEYIQRDLLAKTDLTQDLPLSTRTKNRLMDSGYMEIEQIKALTLDELKNIDGLGPSGVAEIREFLYQKCKFVFLRTKKEKKKILDNSFSCKKVVEHFIGNTNINWAKQLKIANELLKRYTVELLLTVEPKPGVFSLTWYNTDYGSDYINKYLPVVIVTEDKPKEKTTKESLEFIPQINNKPKTLSEFLKIG